MADISGVIKTITDGIQSINEAIIPSGYYLFIRPQVGLEIVEVTIWNGNDIAALLPPLPTDPTTGHGQAVLIELPDGPAS